MVLTSANSNTTDSSSANYTEQHKNITDVCENISVTDKKGVMSETMKRRPLSDAEKADAERLKSIYNRRKRELAGSGVRLTQEELASRCGWAGQSAVSQYLNGRVPLNIEAVMKFARELGVEVADISPNLANAHGLLPGKTPIKSPKHEVTMFGELDPWDDSTPLGADEVELPLYREVELAAGDGRTQVVENGGAKLRFSRRTLSSAGVMKEHAACAYVSGNSMEPALMDGSVVGINKQDLQIRDGKVYAVDHEGMLRVKQVFRLPGGGIRLRSFNIDEFPDEEYGPGWPEYISIIGRVFWSSTMW
ncbi:LexA family transcriptional regulator [Oceanisphaera sp. KMM 10153]|uniref:LexA family transcriptional regulator n=1 Tax=Oceanisphaera submarina TaxID=3390193 RepID=UPI003974DF48